MPPGGATFSSRFGEMVAEEAGRSDFRIFETREAATTWLEEVGDMPGLDELKGAGLLEGNLPPGFGVPLPTDDSTLRDDEDPLDPGDIDLGLAPPASRSEK